MKKPTFAPTFTRKTSVRTFRRMTFVLPVISLMASGGIVVAETMRRDRLAREYQQAEREYTRLEAGLAHMPHGATGHTHSHSEEHDEG